MKPEYFNIRKKTINSIWKQKKIVRLKSPLVKDLTWATYPVINS